MKSRVSELENNVKPQTRLDERHPKAMEEQEKTMKQQGEIITQRGPRMSHYREDLYRTNLIK